MFIIKTLKNQGFLLVPYEYPGGYVTPFLGPTYSLDYQWDVYDQNTWLKLRPITGSRKSNFQNN